MSETVTLTKEDTATVAVKRPRNDNVSFVKIVNSSSTIDEAAERLGITVNSVRSRIVALKKAAKEAGVNLRFKKLPSADRKTRGPATVNMSELVALADELLGPAEESQS